MRHTGLALTVLVLACSDGPAGPEPGSRAMYESCQSGLSSKEELCAEGLVCQGSLDPKASYCAPACSVESEDIWTQDPQCPEIEGFISYCAKPAGGLSCVIQCDNACPDGLGLRCPENGSLCEGQPDS